MNTRLIIPPILSVLAVAAIGLALGLSLPMHLVYATPLMLATTALCVALPLTLLAYLLRSGGAVIRSEKWPRRLDTILRWTVTGTAALIMAALLSFASASDRVTEALADDRAACEALTNLIEEAGRTHGTYPQAIEDVPLDEKLRSELPEGLKYEPTSAGFRLVIRHPAEFGSLLYVSSDGTWEHIVAW